MFSEAKVTEIYCMADNFLQGICYPTRKINSSFSLQPLTIFRQNLPESHEFFVSLQQKI